jgi:hypothetical protein
LLRLGQDRAVEHLSQTHKVASLGRLRQTGDHEGPTMADSHKREQNIQNGRDARSVLKRRASLHRSFRNLDFP